MTYESILYIIMLAVFFGYIGAIWVKYGVLDSISQSYYELSVKWRPLFTLFCWGFAIPAMIIGANGLMFFAGAGIAFVGAAAEFQQKLTKTVHFVGAGLGVLLSQLALILIYNLWPLAVAFIVFSLLMILIKKNAIWWIELAAFIIIVIAYGIRIIF